MRIQGAYIEGDLLIPSEVDPNEVIITDCYIEGKIRFEQYEKPTAKERRESRYGE